MASSIKPSRRVALVLAVGAAAAISLLPAPPAAAQEPRQSRADIRITKDSEFDAAHGVRSGSGTHEDPFVISGWALNNLVIKDTSAHVMIMNNTIRSLAILDWIGDGLHMHDNDVGDLRVNQNVPRTGEATSGEITNNTFRIVGQLRHWDGLFAHNVVGPVRQDPTAQILKDRAVNFDGFNGAIFRDNTIYGYMDARLHGHHHSSGFGQPSHYHGSGEPRESQTNTAEPNHEGHTTTAKPEGHTTTAEPEGHTMTAEPVDHNNRYHEVWITNNQIYSDTYYSLAYLDTGHSANDRTAASENDQALNEQHVHYTRVHMTENQLTGGGIYVFVFNAKDERHTGTARGLVDIANNVIKLRDADVSPLSSSDGINVTQAQDVDLRIVGNSISFEPRQLDPLEIQKKNDYGSGILLVTFDNSDILIENNAVSDRYYGVRAHSFTDSVHWTIKGFETNGVTRPVYWDQTVKNAPEQPPAEEPPPEGGHEGHDH